MAKNTPPNEGEDYFYDKLDDKNRPKKRIAKASTKPAAKKGKKTAPTATEKPAPSVPAPTKVLALALPVAPVDESLRPLSPKQKKFVYFYTQHGNATRAAQQAGYEGDRQTLAVVGSENLRKPNVSREIGAIMGEFGMSEAEYCIRVANRARSSMEPFFGAESDDPNAANLPGEPPKIDLTTEEARLNLGNIRKLKTHTSTTIREDDATEHVTTEIEVYDALPALKMVGDMLGLSGKGKRQKEVPNQPEKAPPSNAAMSPDAARVELARILGVPVEMLPPATR